MSHLLNINAYSGSTKPFTGGFTHDNNWIIVADTSDGLRVCDFRDKVFFFLKKKEHLKIKFKSNNFLKN